MNTFLFIGGSRDGERLPVPSGQRMVELPLPGQRPARKGAPVPMEIYDAMKFDGESECYYVFALRGVSGNAVMRAFIENYPAKSASK